jgi:L-asparagine permease
MSSHGVPYGGIMLTGVLTLLGVALNAFFPSQAFEIVLEVSALGIIGGWATIMLCHMRFVRLAREGKLERPSFRLRGAPFTGYLTLAFLLFVLVTMGFSETGRWVLLSLVVLVPLLIAGWFAARPTIMAAASQREGVTGIAPVLAPRPPVPGERGARHDDDGADPDDPRP